MRRMERDAHGRALRSAGIALWCALLLVAAVVASRRMAGAFAAELPQGAFLLILAVTAALSLIAQALVGCDPVSVRRAAEGGGRFADSWRDNAIPLALTLLPVVVLGAALLPAFEFRGVAPLLALSWLTAAVVLATHRHRSNADVRANSDLPMVTAEPHDTKSPPAANGLPAAAAARPDEMPAAVPIPVAEVDGNSPIAPDEELSDSKAEGGPVDDPARCLQWFTRGRLPSGEERIEGHVTVTFGAEQRMATAHVPFHPPLAGTPEIECEPLEGCDVRLRVAAVHTYGARIEAKRTGTLEAEESVQIGFVAIGAVPRSRAA